MKITCTNCRKKFDKEKYYGICPKCGTFHYRSAEEQHAEMHKLYDDYEHNEYYDHDKYHQMYDNSDHYENNQTYNSSEHYNDLSNSYSEKQYKPAPSVSTSRVNSNSNKKSQANKKSQTNKKNSGCLPSFIVVLIWIIIILIEILSEF